MREPIAQVLVKVRWFLLYTVESAYLLQCLHSRKHFEPSCLHLSLALQLHRSPAVKKERN